MNTTIKQIPYLWILIPLFIFSVSISAQTDCAGKKIGSLHIFPNIPEIKNNPYWKTAFYRLDQGMKNPNQTPSDFKDNFQLGEEIIQAAIAALHPQSMYANKSAVTKRLMLLMDFVFDNWKRKGNLLGNFSVYHETALAYYMIEKANPKLLSGQKRKLWQELLSASTDKVIKERGELWDKKKAEPLWYNADVRYALGVYVSGHLLKRRDYIERSCSFYEYGMQQALLPDGGFNYVGMQNEVFTYHGVCVQSIAWFYLLTGDTYARNLIRKTKNYYPLSIQNGVAEYYTAVSWKHYWNRDNGAGGAYIVASVTGDGENYRIGRKSRHILNPFFYNKGLKEKSERNNFLVYDKNIMGPRGKFGNWAFAGSGRDVLGNGKADNGLGKSTFVGAMVFGGESSSWPLQVALDKVTVEFQKEKGDKDLTERRLSHRFMAMDEKNATSMTKDIAGLSTSYRITDRRYGASQMPTYKNPQTTDWYGNQQWIFSKGRMIGQLEISPNKDEAQFAVNALIRLTSGRSNWGVQRNFRSLGNNTYEFGDLRFKIHKNSFGGPIRQYRTDTYSPNGGNKSFHFIIQDKKSRKDRNTKVSYKRGERFGYIVEFYPKGQAPSAAAESNIAGLSGLRSFQVKRDNINMTLVHNTNSSTRVVKIASLRKEYKTLSVLKSWDGKQQILSKAIKEFSIPAHQHILVFDDNRKGTGQPTPPTPEPTDKQLITDGTYHISSPFDGQRLIAPKWNAHNAQMHTPGNFSDQKWIFKHLGNNVYTIQNQGTKRYLEVPNGQCGNRKNVATWLNANSDHKKWIAVKVGGHFALKPKHCPAVAMDRDKGAKNANVHTWSYRPELRNQHWQIRGINEGRKEIAPSRITVSPVPAQDFLQVNGLEDTQLIVVYDQLGREVLRETIDEQTNTIRVEHLSPGIYFVQIGTLQTTRFSKE